MSDKYTPQDLQDNLDYLNETKALIKQAIIDKEQPVGDNDTFRSYADKIKQIETGIKTDDATATAADIIAPKTAYVNDQKITGTMTGSYSVEIPTQIERTVDYNITLDDVSLKYNVGVKANTQYIYIYRIKDDGTIVLVSSIYRSLLTYFAGTARLSDTPVEVNGVRYLRVFASRTGANSGGIGVSSALIKIDFDKEGDDYIYFASKDCTSSNNTADNTTSTQPPQVDAIPTNPHQCIFTKYSSSGYSQQAGVCYQKYTFTLSEATSSVTCTTLKIHNNPWLGSYACMQTGYRQFSSDGKIMLAYAPGYLATSYAESSFKQSFIWICRFNSNWSSFTDILDNGGSSNIVTNRYCLLGDNLVGIGTGIYSIDDLNTKLATLPFTMPRYNCFLGCVGNFLFLLESTTTTTLKIYKINSNNTITSVQNVTVQAGKLFNHPGVDTLYVTTDYQLVGYEDSDTGTLVALNRLGTDFYNPYDATAIAANILSGKTAYTSQGKISGTMVNNGSKYITPSTSTQYIPQGYHSGSGRVYGDADLIPANIVKGKNIFNVAGDYTDAVQMYASTADMEADTTAKEGTYALIFNEETNKLDGIYLRKSRVDTTKYGGYVVNQTNMTVNKQTDSTLTLDNTKLTKMRTMLAEHDSYSNSHVYLIRQTGANTFKILVQGTWVGVNTADSKLELLDINGKYYAGKKFGSTGRWASGTVTSIDLDANTISTTNYSFSQQVDVTIGSNLHQFSYCSSSNFPVNSGALYYATWGSTKLELQPLRQCPEAMTTEQQIELPVYNPTIYYWEKLSLIADSTLDTNLLSENIKQNIAILGVTGTCISNIEDTTDYTTCNTLAGQIVGDLPVDNDKYIQVTNVLDMTSDNISITDGTLVIE